MGSLPEGLIFLWFEPQVHAALRLRPLVPGVLPSTLLGVDFTTRYDHPLPAGVIPSSVRWIRLPNRYRDENIEAVLPAHAEVSWFSIESAYLQRIPLLPEHIQVPAL